MTEDAKTPAEWCTYASQLVEALPDQKAEQQRLLAELMPIQSLIYDRMISLLTCLEHVDRMQYERIDMNNSIAHYRSFLQQEEEMDFAEHDSETTNKLIVLWAQFRYAHAVFETISTNRIFEDLETAQRIVREKVLIDV